MDFDYFYRNKDQIKVLELHVSNLPNWVDDRLLAQFFSQWGKVRSATILKIYYKETLSGLVRFWDFDQMINALKNSNRSNLKGKRICVDFSKQAVLCCNFCYKFGHMMDKCQHLHSKQRLTRSKIREHDRGGNSRDSSQNYIRQIPSNRERSKSPRKNAAQNCQKRSSPRPYQKKFSQNTLSRNNPKYHDKGSKPSQYSSCLTKDDSMDRTTYCQETNERDYYDRRPQQSIESKQSDQEELEFVKIINTKEDGWASPEDERKLERLQREGFFSRPCYMGRKFVRIVRP